MSSNDDVDAWVAQLMQCKPLSELEVKKLCEKVSSSLRVEMPVVLFGCSMFAGKERE
jgi:serine/threonine-protein phosphatase 2A catalytic subunit